MIYSEDIKYINSYDGELSALKEERMRMHAVLTKQMSASILGFSETSLALHMPRMQSMEN
jgi:hypothetical protein